MAKGGRWRGAVGGEVGERPRADPPRPGPLESRMLGNLPVRFGERGVETGDGKAIEAPANERAGNR